MKPLSQRNFVHRHIGLDERQRAQMLVELGYSDIDSLIRDVVPAEILDETDTNDRTGLGEPELLLELKRLAENNRVYRSLIGEGYYSTHTPAVIQRNVLENPAWYTAYTPYQPEIAQGRLEALILFQTMVTELTGMDISNASLLDEATACAEALSLGLRIKPDRPARFLLDRGCLPHAIDVVNTRAQANGIEIVVGDAFTADIDDYAGVLIRYPNVDGAVADCSELALAIHKSQGLFIVAADLLACALIKPPGEFDADIVVGSSQRLGVPVACGGPHAGFIATRNRWTRHLPGRLVGVSTDTQNRPAYRLSLQTREQHIRRDRATSNICTAQTFPAILAAFYAVWHGPSGLYRIAQRIHHLTARLAYGLSSLGYTLKHSTFFDSLVVHTGVGTEQILENALEAGINLRRPDGDNLGLSLDETSNEKLVEDLLRIFAKFKDDSAPTAGKADAVRSSPSVTRSNFVCLPESLIRRTPFLGQAQFHRYHSETEMMRYLRHLSNKDIGLDTAMIPLGSCTMKLNASVEMIPISWPEFSQVHPHAPTDQLLGYEKIVADLEKQLCRLTGFAAASLQPNAGSQGELAGLLAIKAYYAANGQSQRNICLIPESAHGTNPASAALCGLKVVVVQCQKRGSIDLVDLHAKLEKYRDRLAMIMITYPSTLGVFESDVGQLCDLVHEYGGQIYLDGANFNAMAGLCRPARFGCDICHLNLHKTFCIPHGGGGPGVGPVCAQAHLAPYLPGHRLEPKRDRGAVSGARLGNAGVLPISWSYIRLMGNRGLRQASKCAILAANYIARKLSAHYPLLSFNPQGLVAHECIIDLRGFKSSAGIEVEDIAKRLIDYSFHPPTMSFPVPGALMIEPTECESKFEIDRFIDAMISIRREIAAIELGRADKQDNLLKNAPHCMPDLLSDTWTHPYSRLQAAYPMPPLQQRKHWPPVSRIDQAYGDKNLMCTCPPLEEYTS